MDRWWPKTLTRSTVARMIADVVMMNAALLTAQILTYVWLVGIIGEVISPREALQLTLLAFVNRFWMLTVIGLVIFYLSGFYTRGRRYRGRYKVLVVAQAGSLTYLLFAFVVLFAFHDAPMVGRSVLVVGWLLTLLLLISARLWSNFWLALTRGEELPLQPPPRDSSLQNVLVIGGAGYIGSAVVTRLLDRGYRVRVLDLMAFGKEPLRAVLDHPRLEIMKADFFQVTKVVEAMQDVQAVIHLGAIVGDPASALNEELTVGVNVTATRMIAEVAKGNRAQRFIFASTCSVYGASDEFLDERSMLNPVSLYARSKIAAEKVLRGMSDDHFAPTILRFGTIYGLSGRTRFDLVVNLLSAKAQTEGQITVFGGDQWRPFVHVDDAARAVLAVLEAPLPEVRNQVFNVGSNEQNYTIQQVAEIIHRMLPQAQLVDMGSDADRRNYRVNFDKIRNTLGFLPEWTVEQGVQQVIEAIRTGKVNDYRATKYSNAKYLRLHHVVQAAFNQGKPGMDFLGDEDSSRLIQRSGTEVGLLYDSTVEGWARILEQRNQEAGGRTLRLTEFTLGLARKMGLSEAELVHVRRGVLLHDFGHLGIPDSILRKPGALAEAEIELMRRHTSDAYQALSALPSLKPALDIPYCHHEKWDGTGYPRGLRAEAIPLAARIFAVVDVWDALSSDRPYRQAWPEDQVFQYIQDQAGKHFDPQVVEVFLAEMRPAAMEIDVNVSAVQPQVLQPA
jgi:nucleoside-diphosphate-sugar epimerase